MRLLVTGNYGFIGSQFVRQALAAGHEVEGLDSMTYAANPRLTGDLVYLTHIMDLKHPRALEKLLRTSGQFDGIIHFAAESHVCRSIEGPGEFMRTNILGTFNLLEAMRKRQPQARLIHVSTDEVFGELPLKDSERFSESTQIKPRSPYAASKAASDHLVMAYRHTYGLKAIVTNCTNNFGPGQHEEKLIPKALAAMVAGNPVSVYGNGQQIRDWLYVEDHCAALLLLLETGEPGERYCIGGENERSNLTVIMDVELALMHVTGTARNVTLNFTDDRPTDDLRYAVDCSKMKALGWRPSRNYHDNLRSTVRSYLETLPRGSAARADLALRTDKDLQATGPHPS